MSEDVLVRGVTFFCIYYLPLVSLCFSGLNMGGFHCGSMHP